MELCSDRLIFSNTMEVIYPILKVFEVDQLFLNSYLHCWFRQCEEVNEYSQTRIRRIIKFMSELIDKKLFDITSKIEVWLYYANNFESTKGMKEFHALLKNTLNGLQHNKGS